MSIIILTPKPPQAKATRTNTVIAHVQNSLAARLGEDFLHLLGYEGYRLDSFEQLRDFAQAQIDAASLTDKIDAPVEALTPVPAPAVEGSHDVTAAVTGSAEVTLDSITVLTPPPQ